MKAIISAYTRSPFHFAKQGALATARPDALGALAVQGLLARTDGLLAGLPQEVPGIGRRVAPQGSHCARRGAAA